MISVVTGARLIDRRDFHSIGDGIWWSIVTLGTVGYGDIVPHTAWGRVLGSIVIVCGVTFIAFLTATVTSLFVAVDQLPGVLLRSLASVERGPSISGRSPAQEP